MKNIRIILPVTIVLASIIFLLIEYNETTDDYIYGNSYRQNKFVNTIRLHKYGITGKGVKVGILGSGFDTQHPLFAETRILKEYDFAENKPDTRCLTHIAGTDHGTMVFSVIGGYLPGELVGIAYGADFILAKSDKSKQRLVEEEYYAVKGARWLGENGVRIITTSLSFNKFDNADYYYPSQMDGVSSFITRTADSLVNKGIVFFASAGNQYEERWQIIEPPGDGFKVICVGAINKYKTHAFFSSCGPTADGRIKPDLAAPGEGVWVANHLIKMKPSYVWSHGTSLSAPIAAGIAALILSCHPELNPEQVTEALKMSASQSNNPDNLCGWGVPDAEKAVSYFGPAFSNSPQIIIDRDKITISTFVFSSFGLDKSSVQLHLINNLNELSYTLKENDKNYFSTTQNYDADKKHKFYFTAVDSRGNKTRFPTGFLGEYFTVNQ